MEGCNDWGFNQRVGAENWQGIMENILLLCGPTLSGRILGASNAADEILNAGFVMSSL
jgi:hypothetical protein